jgi:hypothetical protein
MKDLSQDVRCPAQDSNREPPGFESRALPLCQPTRYRNLEFITMLTKVIFMSQFKLVETYCFKLNFNIIFHLMPRSRMVDITAPSLRLHGVMLN